MSKLEINAVQTSNVACCLKIGFDAYLAMRFDLTVALLRLIVALCGAGNGDAVLVVRARRLGMSD